MLANLFIRITTFWWWLEREFKIFWIQYFYFFLYKFYLCLPILLMSEKKVEKLRNNIRKRKAEFLLLTEQSLGSEPAKCIISGSTVDDVLESNG